MMENQKVWLLELMLADSEILLAGPLGFVHFPSPRKFF